MRKDNFVEGEYYHIYNRTIANYRVFNDEQNAKHLMRAFLLANSTKSSEAFEWLRNDRKSPYRHRMSVRAFLKFWRY